MYIDSSFALERKIYFHAANDLMCKKSMYFVPKLCTVCSEFVQVCTIVLHFKSIY